MLNPLAIVTGVKVAISGIRAVKRVHGALSEPDAAGVSLAGKAKNLVVGVPEIAMSVQGIARGEPRPLRISASELSRLYRTNRIAIKADFKGRVALISGELSSVSDARHRYNVKLTTGNPPSLVCRVDKGGAQPDSIAKLRVGQEITLLGVIKGKQLFTNSLTVEYCSLSE